MISCAQSLDGAGASGLADYLRGAVSGPRAGAAAASPPPGARGEANRVTNQQLGQPKFGERLVWAVCAREEAAPLLRSWARS